MCGSGERFFPNQRLQFLAAEFLMRRDLGESYDWLWRSAFEPDIDLTIGRREVPVVPLGSFYVVACPVSHFINRDAGLHPKRGESSS